MSGSRPRPLAPHPAIALPMVALVLAGCFLVPPPRPWTVHDVAERAGYLSAAFARDDETLGFYFEPTADCRAMLVEGSETLYRKRGPLGTLEQGDLQCVPVGIGRIKAWVRRNPVPLDLPILPSAPATFREIYRDADVVAVRGNLPLTALVYLPGGHDAVAFLANAPACQTYIEQGGAAMQYKRETQDVVWFGSITDPCRILGLARPLPPRSEAAGSTE